MLKTEITINRSSEQVWNYFTQLQNWAYWWGGGLKEVRPAWQAGAVLVWELGGESPIERIFHGKLMTLGGYWTSTTFRFIPQGAGSTLVEIEESEPKNGAVFNDGGVGHLAQLQKCLQKMKQGVEELEPIIQSENSVPEVAEDYSGNEQSNVTAEFTGPTDTRLDEETDCSSKVNGETGTDANQDHKMQLNLKNINKTVICAFLLRTTPDTGLGMFRQTAVLNASDEQIKDKIRQQCGGQETEVFIIQPEEWDPPKLNSISQEELFSKFSLIMMKVDDFLTKHGRADLDIRELIAEGTVMPNPMSGRVFFIYKIKPVK